MMRKTEEENIKQAPSKFGKFGDDFEEYLEYLSRITPTTLPEWMD